MNERYHYRTVYRNGFAYYEAAWDPTPIFLPKGPVRGPILGSKAGKLQVPVELRASSFRPGQKCSSNNRAVTFRRQRVPPEVVR
jgi:hypothetical protein